jgi:small subunit ribosomal protein S4
MGDPRKQRKKYSGPQHPWNRARIEEEKVLITEYGLKNKTELWKATSKLSSFKKQAKTLTAAKSKQAEKEKELFLIKLTKLSLLSENATLDNVLDISIKDLLERRLQTIVYRKGLARSVKQARQFIVHEHIFFDGQKMNVPSFLVKAGQEVQIEFDARSALSDPEHAERKLKELEPKIDEKKAEEEEAEEEEAKKEEVVVKK